MVVQIAQVDGGLVCAICVVGVGLAGWGRRIWRNV